MSKKETTPRSESLKSLAAMQSRKELEKELSKARDIFNVARAEYDTSSTQLQALQEKVNTSQQTMINARNQIIALSNRMQIMDLTGANAVKDRGDNCTYVVDGKEYKVDKNDADINMTLWKDYKKQKEDEQKASDELIADAFKKAVDEIKVLG